MKTGYHVWATWGKRTMSTVVKSEDELSVIVNRALDDGYRSVNWRDLATGRRGIETQRTK